MIKCSICGWEGEEKDLNTVPICPECTTGHLKMFRMIFRKDGTIECPKCSWRGPKEDAEWEPECPKCGKPYLIEEQIEKK